MPIEPQTTPKTIAEKWAKDWWTIAPRYKTSQRLAKQIEYAIKEALCKINQ